MASESERREFTRLGKSVTVRYKFLSATEKGPDIERVLEGSTVNLSLGGLMLLGPIPNLDWLKDILLGRMQVGVNIVLPDAEEPVKALTRVAWVESIDEAAIVTRLGLRIQEMSGEHRQRLSRFLMRATAIP